MEDENDSYIKEQKELRKKLMNLIAELDKAELDKKEQLTLQKSFKQETLEEAAEKYENSFKESDGTESVDFIEGAKWQAERSYNEEEVLEILQKWSMYQVDIELNKLNTKELSDVFRKTLSYKEWFEQFKKK